MGEGGNLFGVEVVLMVDFPFPSQEPLNSYEYIFRFNFGFGVLGGSARNRISNTNHRLRCHSYRCTCPITYDRKNPNRTTAEYNFCLLPTSFFCCCLP